MLLRNFAFLSIALAFVFYSCSPRNSQVVAKFGNQDIGLKEFEKAYAANEGGIEQAKKDSLSKMKNYLDLYVDFKMKLRDAYVRGYDRDSSLQAEINNYKKKIGVTYILDHQLINPAIKKLYDKRKWEYRLSYLLIKPQQNNAQSSIERADKILDSLKNGANWDEMVKKYSDDKNTSLDGGDIFYFTAGELPYQLEDAMYATDSGYVYPKVLDTQFGYIILKVTDKRLRRPEIRASHIMISFYDMSNKLDSIGAWKKINAVMQKLKAGEDFAKLAREYSQDPGSKDKGGDLGFFQIRRMVKPFAEAAFNLKQIGDISGIVKTQYGYHIIKLTGIKPYPSFEEEQNNLKSIYQKQLFQADYDSLVAKLETKYNYHLNNHIVSELIKNSDTLTAGHTNAALEKMKYDTLFSYAGQIFSVNDLLNYINSDNTIKNSKYTNQLVKNEVNKASGETMLEHEADGLEKTDPQFASIINDYKDGVYIFKLQEDEVWSKIKPDSTELYNYFMKNRDEYLTKPKVSFLEIFSKSDSLITHYYNLLNSGTDFDSLATKYTERPQFREKHGLWQDVDTSSSIMARVACGLKNPGEFSKPFKVANGFSIVQLVKKFPVRQETFEEAKTEVAGAYQDFKIKELEKDYLDRLNKIYKPKLYYDKLEEAYKEN